VAPKDTENHPKSKFRTVVSTVKIPLFFCPERSHGKGQRFNFRLETLSVPSLYRDAYGTAN